MSRFWKLVSRLRNNKKSDPESYVLNNEKGVESRNMEEFKCNWVNFYQKLYSRPLDKSSSLVDATIARNKLRSTLPSQNGPLSYDVSIKEFEYAMKVQKNGKASGYDGITHEQLKRAPKEVKCRLRWIISNIFKYEIDPVQLKVNIINPLLKDSDSNIRDPINYRPISLVSQIIKIYETIISTRFK